MFTEIFSAIVLVALVYLFFQNDSFVVRMLKRSR